MTRCGLRGAVMAWCGLRGASCSVMRVHAVQLQCGAERLQCVSPAERRGSTRCSTVVAEPCGYDAVRFYSVHRGAVAVAMRRNVLW